MPRAQTLELVDGAVKSLLARVCQVSFLQVASETTLSSCGLDSLRAMELRNLIGAELGVEVPATLLLSGATVGDVAEAITGVVHDGPAPALDEDPAAPDGLVGPDGPVGEGQLPLSFGQERLWFLHQLDPSSTAYNLAGAAWLTGPVTAADVERCVAEIARRHDSLRTVFDEDGGVPYRRVVPLAVSVPVADLTGLTCAEQEQWLRDRVAAEERQPFDLTRGPLLRITLAELGGDRRALVLGIHHIIADGASLSLLMRELALLLGGQGEALPVLPASYSDHVMRQRSLARTAQHERSRAYWLDRLGGELPVLDLPSDRPPPAVESSDGISRSARLPDALARELRALAARHQTTLFTVLLSAFEVLLHRYSGQTDLVIGTPVAGRSRREHEPIIGFFADTLVLRTDLSGRPSFAQVLDRTRRCVLEGLDHQGVPLGQIVAALRSGPQGGRASLFSVMFTVNRLLASDGPGVGLRQLLTPSRTARFDLDLAVTEQGDDLTAVIECRADRFDAGTAERMLEHYRVLLASIVRDPDIEIARLDLLPAVEQAAIHAVSRTPADDPAPDVIAAFERCAARTPDAVAVRCGEEAVTYRELAERADRIARRLRDTGLAPDGVVGVFADRGPAFVAAVLGVLEAGGAWLVLDPQQPRTRHAQVLAEIQAWAVVATENHAHDARDVLAAARSKAPVVTIGPGCDAPDRDADPAIGAGAPAVVREAAAYAIFTSGTTGVPKGALVQRASLDHHLQAFARQLGLGAGDRIAQHAPHSFDATIWQFLAPLTVGAEVHIVSDEQARDPEQLYRALCEQRITVVDVVPAMLEAMLDAARSHDAPPALRRVVVGGDVLPVDLARRWLGQFPAIPLVNAYGPSECTDVTTVYDVAVPPPAEHTRLPIGRPRPGSAAYVLDAEMQLVPLGVPGELYLGGIGVARGYAGRPGWTADRFVPDPWSAEPGARLYRTGDVARWRADGELEFLGRRDGQVKLRGARVELGDIEAHLRAAPGVRDAAVLAVGDGADRRLVAFVVAAGGNAGARSEALRRGLGDVLPPYMVPANIVELDELPRTALGKLDVRALRERAAAIDLTDEDYLAPRDELEREVAAIWAQVLGVSQVGARADFFALGGHSLLAAQVISRVRERLQRSVPVRALFTSPTLEAFARAIRDAAPCAPAGAIPRAPRGGKLPLSYAQSRLWFLQQLDPSDTSYHVHGALVLDGPLDVETLERSLATVIARHEGLRTSFHHDRGVPYQVIHDRVAVEIRRLDVRSEGAPLDAAARLLEAEAQKPFDLSRPLIRVHLARVASERHVLGICLHHLIVDGWSIALFVDELSRGYRALSRGEPIAEPALPIQCADHAAWQVERLESGALADDVAYWRGVFEQPVPPLQLPTDRAAPAVRPGKTSAARLAFPIRPSTAAGIRALCEREDASLFMVLVAAFNALLHHYTGAEDIAIGTPVAGRSRPELEGLIGCFVNTLVLRTDLSGRPSFRELLGRVRRRALEAFDHQELPFDKLVEEVHPDRDPGQQPLFQVMFALQNTRGWKAELPGIAATPLEMRVPAAKFDLFLETWEEDGALHAAFEYTTELFDAATVARFAGHFARLLDAIVETPDERVLRLAIVPEAEQRQLAAWNGHRADFHIETGFAPLFEGQAVRTPDATAVVCESDRLSYRELDRRADQVARFLAERGAGAEQLVALLDERGVDLLTAIAGVFKAGAAYVPLDPRHPTARHAQILAQSASRVLVCGRALEPEARAAIAAVAAAGACPPALHVIDEIIGTAAESADRVASRSQPVDLAYVIFTSGTTGVPKGAMIDQRGMLNHLYSKILTLGLSAGDVVLQDASQCFDISVWQSLAALLVGGQVAIVRDDVARDPARLYGALDERGVTVFEVVPTMLRALLDEIRGDGERAGKLSRVRAVVSNAETLPPEMLREWLVLYPQIPMFNTYGATECSDDVAIVRLDQPVPRDRVPVGQPVGNMAVYALNRELGLAPIGVPGELYIAGPAVGRGYLGRPVLTAGAFVPDPFSPVPGARCYRTGDLGRYTADGQLDFLGRHDDQVKIRGHRIELSEIEARIAEHPEVKQAVVLAIGEAGADREIVAYVAASDPGVVDALRAALRQQLPSYMVPALFVVMERFPVTRNGKIDRAALPRPTREQLRRDDAFVAPRDEREHIVAAVWAEVLGLERVGIHDNFFDLGGHSLLATRVIARLRERFERDLPLRGLFQHPTIAGYVAHALGGAGEQAARHALVPVPRDGELPLSFAQQRFWFLAQLDPDDPSYNVHYALRLEGPVDMAALERAIHAVTARHEALRTSFVTVDGVPHQRICDRLDFAIETIDLQGLADPEDEARRRIEREADRTFDLAELPLFRIALYRIAPETQVLFFNMHHIICDGWSMGVFIQEVGACYAAFLEGGAPELPALDLQGYDHAVWQRAWLASDGLEPQLGYWRGMLGRDIPHLELPLDFPRPRVPGHRGGKLEFSLGAELSAALHALCQREGVTLYMVMAAALATLLHRVAHSEDLTIGSPIAGRNRPELEGLIGCFINTLVLRVELAEQQTFRQLLAQVRQRTLEAYDNQDVPFEKIVEELAPDRDLAAHPMFQVMLVLHNLFGAKVAMPGVASRHFAYESHTAKFDLLLALWETDAVVAGEWEYRSDLFTRATVERMHDHWVHVLRGATADADVRLADIALVDEAAARAELAARNATDRPLPERGMFPEIFARRARQYAGRIAVECGDDRLTYEALDARSNQIAHALRGQGLGAESVVAVMLERGIDHVASVLGVWKAGCAYLPIDLGHPDRRIAGALASAHVCAAITSRGWADRAAGLCAASPGTVAVITIEDTRTAPPAPVAVDIAPLQLAYVIFTSGSTGVPKGAMLHHQGMVNHLFAKALDLGLGERDVVAQIAVQTFDVSIWQMFSALLVGGKTVVLTGDDAWEPRRLFANIQRAGITTVQSVPTHMKALVAELEAAPAAHDLSSLRWLIMNGEGLPPDLCRRWFALQPGAAMVNMYGLTECSDDSCHHHIPSAPSHQLTYMPIDGTLMNHRIYVVDDALRPTPVGLAGELCIGGIGVGRGYAGDPARTAQAFVPDPFSSVPGARMYRTGDRVRTLADGSLVFVERMDHQIKLRGRRIDIGEIEAALREHPQVADAAVKVFTGEGAYARLVAYLVSRIKPAPLLSNVVLHLQERLPEYMVPSELVYLDELPRTDNGKLDRTALVAPVRSEHAEAAAHRAPATATEQTIAEIWSALLGVAEVGLDDSYFALGGHSLAAAEMTTRVKKHFQIDVPMRVVFDAPVLEDYAARIDRLRAHGEPTAASASPAVELDLDAPLATREVYDLAPQQIPEWYAYTLDPSSPVYNVCLTLFLDGEIDRRAFLDAWNLFVARHPVFRLRQSCPSGKPVQRLGPPAQVCADELFIDRSGVAASAVRDDARQVADQLGNQVFDLAEGPNFRVRLVSYPERRHLLVFVVHHIVWDETSTIHMIQEFSAIYNALARGQRPELPALPLDYPSYAQRMHDAARAGAFESDRAYWLEQFASPPPALDLPTDRPRPAILSYEGSTVDCWFPREVRARLDAYLREHNATLFMFLLAALDLYLYRITGNDDLVVGCPIANRDHEATRGMLGLFAAPLPLRARLRDDMRFSELLRQVAATAVDGYEHHRYPSSFLIEELDLPKDLSRPRLFSVMFGVQNNKTQVLDHFHLDGLKISLDDQIHGPEWSTARFDLTFVVDQFGDDISLAVNFNSQLFERATADRMMRQLVHLVEQVLTSPDQALWDYALMPAAEAQHIATAFNQTAAAYPDDVTVAHLFAARAAACPERIAVAIGERTHSYAELARRAGEIGRALASRGVGPRDRVAVMLDPSFDLLAGVLGILDGGAAYVPLAPDTPEARVRAIVSDAGIRWAIASARHRGALAASGVEVICVDELEPGGEPAPLAMRAHPGGVAYIIYTSGTTGTPKGIEIEHRGLVNYLAFLQREYELDERDRVLMATSYVFDASVVEVFWPLASGARIAIAPADQRADPAALAQLVHAHGATVLQGVPQLVTAVADALTAPPGRLRLTIVGGAALGREARDKLVRALPGRVMNHYGPTEVTVDASTFDCSRAFDGAIVPIGRPISNARIYVLDRRMRPVPIGVPGEIYVASPGLARGYVGDPQRTAQAFSTCAVDGVARRLYRTGDLGKYDAGGNVHYLGRRDKQVKVRGNRVEIEEIVARLAAHPDVGGCAVVAVDRGTAAERLAAYVELTEASNALVADGATYRMFTLAQRPELRQRMEAAHLESWPAFFAGAPVTRDLWPRIWTEFPHTQFALVDAADEVVAAGNALPARWSGDPASLPAGWDDALTRALARDPSAPADTLLILTGVVVASHQGRGLAACVLEAFKALARGHGLARAVVPVRPTGKAERPDLSFAAWCQTRRPDGAAADPWLRIHERAGGKALCIAPRSQRVVGSIAQWEAWTGMAFTRPGPHAIPGALAPVDIDLERGVGAYDEPSIWYEHFVEPDRGPAWRPIDRAALRAYLAEALPDYMVPDLFCLRPCLPRGASGKIDEQRLPPPPEQAGRTRPPETALQVALAERMRDALGATGGIGIADDFFALGGQSLLAIRLLARIRQDLGVAVELKEFYREPTIEGLERRVAQRAIARAA